MFCKNCGEQLEDHARFCPKCGTVAAGKVEEPKYEAAGKTGIEEKQQFRPVYALIAGVVLLLLLCVVILPKKPEKLILGEWYGAEDGTGLEFNKDGTGQIGKFYSFQWDIDRYEILTLKFEYEDLELELAWDADDKGKVSGTWYVDKESIAISGEDYYRSEAEALAHSGEAEVETEQELEPDEGGYLADAEPEEEAAQTGVSDEEREKEVSIYRLQKKMENGSLLI